MKTLVLTDAQASYLNAVLEGIAEAGGEAAAGAVEILEKLNGAEFTKESYSALPVADFKTIDETMKHSLNFIARENKYNDVKNITASAICDYLMAGAGFKTRKA